MAITTPCYCSREDVKSATDMQGTAYNNAQIDRAIQEAARNIDGHLHRKFYPEDKTVYFDWPAQSGQGGGQITYPWKLYFDANDLLTLTTVQSPPGTSLNTAYFNLEPADYGPPYTYLEIQRDKSIAFSGGSTPQRAVQITGTWGYTQDKDQVGTLVSTINGSTQTVVLTDGSQAGVGDLLIIDSERMLVSEKAAYDTGVTQQGSGCSTTNDYDNILALLAGSSVNVDEVIALDSEKMLVLDIIGNNVTVKRGYDGTPLATHTGAEVFAYRSLTVQRGQLGTSSASHTSTTAVYKHRVPYMIRNLAIAEAVNVILQETGGYSNPQGEDQATVRGLGSALADKWDEARTAYGRKARMRTV